MNWYPQKKYKHPDKNTVDFVEIDVHDLSLSNTQANPAKKETVPKLANFQGKINQTEQTDRAREDRIFLQSKHGMRAKLRHLREQVEPLIDAKLAKHQGLSHKLDVILRGGRPRTFALVGPSGTGKSFRALLFAENQNIPYLIDDGILIKGGKIIAGRSAKNEPIYIKAIKTALFDDAEHLKEVRNAIKQHKVQRILLVGTSVRMVSMIVERLGLTSIAPADITYIEEISNPEEIAQAKKSRHAGHHIIPVPALEVSRAYSNLIRDGFQVFLSDIGMGLKKKFRNKKSQKIFEKTVVQPPFMKTQQKGKIQITESALRQIIIHCIDEYNREISVTRMKIRLNPHKVTVYISLPMDQGRDLNNFLHKLQGYIVRSLHRYAGLVLGELNIKVSNFKKASE